MPWPVGSCPEAVSGGSSITWGCGELCMLGSCSSDFSPKSCLGTKEEALGRASAMGKPSPTGNNLTGQKERLCWEPAAAVAGAPAAAAVGHDEAATPAEQTMIG